MKKNVLVLASTFPRWKSDTTPPFVFELEKRLTKDFNIIVLAPHYKGAKKFEVMNGLKVYRFNYLWPEYLQKLCYEGGILPKIKQNKLYIIQGLTLIFCEFFHTINLLKKEKIDLIHAHWIIPQGIIAYIVNKLNKTPYIITSHGSDVFGLNNPLFQRLRNRIITNSIKSTVVSNSIKNELLKSDKSNQISHKIEVLSMGVDSKLFNPDKYDQSIKEKYNINGPFLLFVGRLAEVKGVHYLINAMTAVIKTYPKAKLLIIGKGTLEEELKNLTNELNLHNNVIFVGAIANHDLPRFYATADLFVAPSITTSSGEKEGFGLTLIEASFSGCVPIGTKIGGIVDIIKDRTTGMLIEEKNANSISAVIIDLLKNNKVLKEIKIQSREINRKKFDWLIIANQFVRLYNNSFN